MQVILNSVRIYNIIIGKYQLKQDTCILSIFVLKIWVEIREIIYLVNLIYGFTNITVKLFDKLRKLRDGQGL